MTTYQKAIQVLGTERTHIILINAINEELKIGSGNIPDIELFQPWVEMQPVNRGVFDKFQGTIRIFDRYMKFSEVRSPNRQSDVVAIRHILRWYYCHFPDLSLRQAGSIVYPCDHTIAIHSKDKVKDMLESKDPYYTNAVNSLKTFCAENQIFTINL